MSGLEIERKFLVHKAGGRMRLRLHRRAAYARAISAASAGALSGCVFATAAAS